MRPGRAVNPSAAAAAIAVVRGARTTREVQAAVGWLSPSTAYKALWGACREGLVDWEWERRGTLHATVTVVTDWGVRP
jgi:hypothetical protein